MKKAVCLVAVLLLLAPAVFAATGAETYKAKCSTCHSADGSGTSAMGKKLNLRPLGSAEVQSQTDAQLIQITTKGKNKMPAYEGKLSAEDIKAVVAHIRTLKK